MGATQNGGGRYATAGWAGGAQPILVVDRYAKSYGGRRAVDGVSLSVGQAASLASSVTMGRARRRSSAP